MYSIHIYIYFMYMVYTYKNEPVFLTRLQSLFTTVTSDRDKHTSVIHYPFACGEPAISLHLHHVSLVQWTTRLLPIMRDPGSIPRGYLCGTGIFLLALSHYIGDPDMIDHCGLV
jgi:hypothetical protein